MGAGNFILDDAKTVYILNEEIYPEDEDGQISYDSFYLEDVVENILNVLPKSYYTSDGWCEDGKVIAENGLYLIVTHGWEGYLAVSVVPKDESEWGNNIHSLAAHHLPARATAIFNELDEMYDLHIRCSAWTSGKYQRAA